MTLSLHVYANEPNSTCTAYLTRLYLHKANWNFIYNFFLGWFFMFYIGIDIAKQSHQVAFLDNNGNSVVKPFVFQNSNQGFEKLVVSFTKYGFSKDNSVIAMEATSHYWFALYFFLSDLGFSIKVFNPIQTDAFRDLSIRKVKNDVIDSINIAELLRFGKFSECVIPDENSIALKNLSRFRYAMVDLCSDFKRKVICLLNQVFTEYDKSFL